MEDEDHTLRFTDFLEGLGMNPKIVREHALRLYYAGLVETPRRGTFRLSEKGQFCFMMTGFALRRMLTSFKEGYEE